MSRRLDTTGCKVHVEYRKEVNLYFVVYEDLGVELAPAFHHRLTAGEIARQAYLGTPFFMMIPTVAYRTCYPRPGLVMPKDQPIEIPLRIV
jgi:hypothetical protein